MCLVTKSLHSKNSKLYHPKKKYSVSFFWSTKNDRYINKILRTPVNDENLLQRSYKISETSSVGMSLKVSIFTSQQNLVMESGVHSFLHPNCHHQIDSLC